MEDLPVKAENVHSIPRINYSVDPVQDPMYYYKTLKLTNVPPADKPCSEPRIAAFVSARNFVPPKFTVKNPSPFVKHNLKARMNITEIPRKATRGRRKSSEVNASEKSNSKCFCRIFTKLFRFCIQFWNCVNCVNKEDFACLYIQKYC